jgi:hemin uptake protein HemP
MDEDQSPSQRRSAPQPGPSPAPIPCVRSEELLKGGRELMIAHGQELYRLRLTKSGKLILGK